MRARLSLLGLMRVVAVVAAIGSALILVQVLSRQPTGRECEITDQDTPCALRGMRMPGVSLQLAHSTYEVGHIAHSRGAREALLLSTRRDYLAIPIYCLLFVGVGLILGRDNPTLGAIVMACAVGAAVLDIVENIGITAELTTKELTPWMVTCVLWISSSKWLLLFGLVGALSVLCLRRESMTLKVVGIDFVCVAVIGVYGLAMARPMVEQAFLLMLGGIIPLSVSLLFDHQQFAVEKAD